MESEYKWHYDYQPNYGSLYKNTVTTLKYLVHKGYKLFKKKAQIL